MPKLVYDFTEGNKDLKDLLGGKGANLAEMTNLGLPVPPGFVITTEACRYYLEQGSTPAGLDEEIAAHLDAARSGDGPQARRPGRPAAGQRQVRGEVLHAGHDGDRPEHRPVRRVGPGPGQAGRQRAVRLGLLPAPDPDVRQDRARHRGRALRARHRRGQEGQGRPQRPRPGRRRPAEPGRRRSRASSSPRPAGTSRRSPASRWTWPSRPCSTPGTPTAPSSTAARSASPPTSAPPSTWSRWSSATWAWTRAPASRSPGTRAPAPRASTVTTCRTPRARTSWPGSGTPSRCRTWRASTRPPTTSSCRSCRRWRTTTSDLCDIEFTIERGKLWMLQTRVGKRTAAAAFRIATQLVDQDLIDMDEAVRRVSGEELARLMFPRFDTSGEVTKIAKGISASPGAAVGKAVFDSARAVELAGQGEKVILVRRETNPDDLHGMIAAQGILTSRGGKTSHAAVVARGMGKTCVCGADELEVDTKAKKFTAPGGITVSEGDMISIDGTSGVVYTGEVPVVASEVVRYFEGELHPHSDEADDLIRAVHSIMHHADAGAPARRLRQRRHRPGLRPGPPVRRRRRRPGPHRAHVPRRAPPAGRGPDPGRHRRRAAARAGRPGAAAARRLRGDPGRHGRPAGDDPADRPAAARVPARPDRTLRQDRPGRRRGHRQGQGAAGRGAPAARAEPHARPARRPARPGHPRPVRHAGPRDRARGGRAQAGGQGPAPGGDDPAHRDRAGDGDQPRARREGAQGGRGGDRHPRAHDDRHHDRGAAGGPERRARSPPARSSSPSARTT